MGLDLAGSFSVADALQENKQSRSGQNRKPAEPKATTDYPPHFWIERQTQYLVCGSDRAVAQARAAGHAPEFIFQASGMIVDPRFYAPQPDDRSRERERLGLFRDFPTGLVLFGGYGNRVMLEIADRLDSSELELQLILICGKNLELAKMLRGRKSRLRY